MYFVFFFVKQKTAYDMRISDWSSDVCSSDLRHVEVEVTRPDPGPLVIDIGPSTGTLTGTGIDSVALDPPPPPLPPLIAAQADPRYAAALQPAYPSAERRANRERTEEHQTELQSLIRTSYDDSFLQNKKILNHT